MRSLSFSACSVARFAAWASSSLRSSSSWRLSSSALRASSASFAAARRASAPSTVRSRIVFALVSSVRAPSSALARAAASCSVRVRRTAGLLDTCSSGVSRFGDIAFSAVDASLTAFSAAWRLTSSMEPPAPWVKVRLRRTSTETDLVRPCEKLWRTCPAFTVFLSSSRPGRAFRTPFFSSFSLLIFPNLHNVSARRKPANR